MTVTDEHIRSMLQNGVRATEPPDPEALADRLTTRAAERRRSRLRFRFAGGAVAAVLVVAGLASVANHDDGTDVVAGQVTGTDSATSSIVGSEPGSVYQSQGYQSAPNLMNLLELRDADLILVGEVQAVEEAATGTPMVPPPGRQLDPPISYDYVPIVVDVEEYLHVADGAMTPDPIRLRAIGLRRIPGPNDEDRTTVEGRAAPAVGTTVLVFASAPVDVGDGVAAAVSVIFTVSTNGVIDEAGNTVPLDDVRDRLATNPSVAGQAHIGDGFCEESLAPYGNGITVEPLAAPPTTKEQAVAVARELTAGAIADEGGTKEYDAYAATITTRSMPFLTDHAVWMVEYTGVTNFLPRPRGANDAEPATAYPETLIVIDATTLEELFSTTCP